jgi:hypothetical protein
MIFALLKKSGGSLSTGITKVKLNFPANFRVFELNALSFVTAGSSTA